MLFRGLIEQFVAGEWQPHESRGAPTPPPTRGDEMAALKNAIERLRQGIGRMAVEFQRSAGYAAHREWRLLLSEIRDPRRLEHWGRKIYSQNDEDGILAEILRRIEMPPGAGHFVECGAGGGLENNTHYLLRQGYAGVWLEGATAHVEAIRRWFASYIAGRQLAIYERFITAETVNDALRAVLPSGDLAVLSIDIDGNEYWVWDAVTCVTPSVVIIAYNGKWPPPLSQVQPYRPNYVWDGTDCFGASLSALTKLGARKGYSLVACNITGTNSFFVRDDLVRDRFPFELTAENLYHPPRYDLTLDCFSRVAHRPAAGILENV
jgi:hypothetical protein